MNNKSKSLNDKITDAVTHNVSVVILFIVCLLVVIAAQIVVSVNTSAMTELENTVYGLDNEYDVLTNSKLVQSSKASGENAVLDSNRKSLDDELVEKLFKSTFAWTDSDSYASVKKSIINDYDLATESVYITSIFPDEMAYSSAAFDSMDAHVTNISGDKYSYLSTVIVNVKNVDGTDSQLQYAITYAVQDNMISDLNVWQLV